MGVALVKKTTDGEDPRAGLRQAIAAAAKAQVEAEQHQQAIQRAESMVAEAEARVSAANEALISVREKHAQALAEAATSGQSTKSSNGVRNARLALSDAEDELEAAKAAFEHLQEASDGFRAENPQIDNQILIEVARVVAPIAERFLEQMRQRQAELLALQQAFLALTDEPTDRFGEQQAGIPSFGNDIQRLNAADARRAPVKELRERFFNLDRNVGQERAREVAAAFRRWRSELRRNADAPEPDGKS
jgi:hypothetical protein